MKKFLSTLILSIAVFGNMASAQEINPQKATFDDFMPLFVYKGYESFPFDISSFSDRQYTISFSIREYENGEKINDNILLWNASFKNMLMLSDFSGDRQSIKTEDMYDAQRGIYKFSDKMNIGIMPDNDSTKLVMMSVNGRGSAFCPLKLHPQTDTSGKKFYGYHTRPFKINKPFVNGEFTPLVLVGSVWFDKKFNIHRFCGENEIEPDLTTKILEYIPHYYVIGITVTPSNKDNK